MLAEIKTLLFTEGIEVQTPTEGTPLSPGTVSFTMSNNQSSAQDVTGFIIDETVKRSARIEYQIRLTDGNPTETLELGEFFAYYHSVDGWVGSYGQRQFADSEVVLSITTAGQIQYTSPNLTGGSESLILKYRVTTFEV